MEGISLKANRHLRFQKCLPTEYSQSASKVTNGLGDVNVRLPRIAWLEGKGQAAYFVMMGVLREQASRLRYGAGRESLI